MPIDPRRELSYIHRQYGRFQQQIGENILWFKFDPTSRWDDIYDEGGRSYHPAIRVPALWVDQIEDPEQYSAEGRRPRQRFRCAVSAHELRIRNISPLEAHGRELGGVFPSEVPPPPNPPQLGREEPTTLDDRLNDLIYYDKRFYAISNFQIRGRAKFADVVVGVSGLELITPDESLHDLFPWNTPYADGQLDLADGQQLDTSGLPLAALVDTTPTWSFDFGVDPEGTWTLRIFSDSGVVVVPGHPVPTTDVGVDVTLPDGLTLGQYRWELRQQFGVLETVVESGPLYIVTSYGYVGGLDVIGTGASELTLSTWSGEAGVWTFHVPADATGDWELQLFDASGGAITTLPAVYGTPPDKRTFILPASISGTLPATGTRWLLVQIVSGQVPNILGEGLLAVQES